MPTRLIASLCFALLCLIASFEAQAEEASSSTMMTPEAAFDALAEQSELDDAAVDQADAVIKQAVKASPGNARWVMAQSMILIRRGDTDKAYDLAKKAVKLDPDDAMVQYLFGNAAFAHINDVSFINMGAVSNKGKEAYERAVELDPDLIPAHMGLATFYLYAPGIAGGSVSKSREIATTIGAIDGGQAQAALLRMQIEAKEENWGAFNAAAQESIDLAKGVDNQQAARVQIAITLIFAGKRHEEALTYIRQIREAEASSGAVYREGTVSYLEGLCLQETGDLKGAIQCYERTLAVNPGAQNTRFNLAECYEELDKPALAAQHYSEFASRFKDDDRAKSAKKKAKKLEKQASKG